MRLAYQDGFLSAPPADATARPDFAPIVVRNDDRPILRGCCWQPPWGAQRGIQTVGIDRVIAHAGVAKGSLYYSFSGKDELVPEYLTHRHGT
jgi:hypothetical protein